MFCTIVQDYFGAKWSIVCGVLGIFMHDFLIRDLHLTHVIHMDLF